MIVIQEATQNIKVYLNDQFQVSGYIKPGAGTKTILEQATKDVDNLADKDFILCCVSNDIVSPPPILFKDWVTQNLITIKTSWITNG